MVMHSWVATKTGHSLLVKTTECEWQNTTLTISQNIRKYHLINRQFWSAFSALQALQHFNESVRSSLPAITCSDQLCDMQWMIYISGNLFMFHKHEFAVSDSWLYSPRRTTCVPVEWFLPVGRRGWLRPMGLRWRNVGQTGIVVAGATCDERLLKRQTIDLSHKSHSAPVPYPTMLHFVTEMCTHVHISVTKLCIVGYLSDALWDLWEGYVWTQGCSWKFRDNGASNRMYHSSPNWS